MTETTTEHSTSTANGGVDSTETNIREGFRLDSSLTGAGAHLGDVDDSGAWRVWPAEVRDFLTLDEARIYIGELQTAVDRAEEMAAARKSQRTASAAMPRADLDG